MKRVQLILLLALAGACLAMPMSASAAFGLTSTTDYYRVDTGAGLVFKIRRIDYGSSTQSPGDIMSLVYNGIEYQDQSRGTHVNSGFDWLYEGISSASVTAELVDADHIKITVDAGYLTHYYIARNGDPNIYMGTYFTVQPTTVGELCRFIVRMPEYLMPNIPAPGDIRNNTGAIESGDIFGMADGTTRSKHYSNMRLNNWAYFGATGSNVGAWMVRDNHEGGSGGPFYRSLLQQCGSDQELTYIINYGQVQTEAFRTHILNTYTLVFTNGEAPGAVDTSWLGGMDLVGYVADAGRGSVSCAGISNRDASYPYTAGFANSTAQHWGEVDMADGSFNVTGMHPGTYTMSIYKNELAVHTASVVVSAGGNTVLDPIVITNDPSNVVPLWRIGNWDGTPAEFLNGDKVTSMHPSDVRMDDWNTGTYVVGTSIPGTGMPCYQWKDVAGGSQTIQFELTAGQLVDSSVRVGITVAYAGGRPNIGVNGWTSSFQSSSSQPNSRSLTTGSYRGNNTTYTFNIPASALVVGTNNLYVYPISGSGSTGFLSAGYSLDCIEWEGPEIIDPSIILFSEDFEPPTSGVGNQNITTVGWVNDIANADAARIFEDGANHAVWSWHGNTSTEAFYTTTSMGAGFESFDLANVSDLTFSVDNHSGFAGNSTAGYFALQLDDADWYVSATSVGAPTATWTNHQLVFDPTASNWKTLAVSGAGSLNAGATIGGSAGSDLSGLVTGVGFVVDRTTSATHDFDDFLVTGIRQASAPTGLNATAVSSSRIDLDWTASTGAESYNVKRSTTSDAPYTTIATGVTGTSYSDDVLSSATTYYYVVSAVNAHGESADSTEANATTLEAIAYYRFEEGVVDAQIEFGNPVDAPYIPPHAVVDSAGGDDNMNSWWSGSAPYFRNNTPAATLPLSGENNTLSAQFNGDDDLYAALGGPLKTTIFSDFTVEAYINFSDVSGWQTIVGRDDSWTQDGGQDGNAESLFYLAKSGADHTFRAEVCTDGGDMLVVSSAAQASINTWYHLAAVGDVTAGTLTLYVNGISVGSTSGYDGLFDPAEDNAWTIGRGQFNGYGGDYVKGFIDEVRFAAVALDPTRLLNYTDPDTDTDGLDDAWEMDHFGDLNETGSGDPDGDGDNNETEETNGTDPRISSIPPLIGYSFDGGMLSMSWPINNTGWRMEYKTNLLSTVWIPIPNTDTTNLYETPADETEIFFRLVYP